MLKAGIKRRRTTRQITDEKAEAAVRQMAIEEKLAKFDQLQQDLKAAKEEAEVGKNATQILTGMLEKGEVEQDENGYIQVKPQAIDQSNMSQSSQQQQQQDMLNGSNSFQI